MGKKSLGIDISDGNVTGVVLEQHGKISVVTACLSLPFSEGDDIVAQARRLCEQLDWREGACVCGLPLSLLSVRNLTLPFRDINKIKQVLPFELEEQLIVPVETLIADSFLSQTTDSGSLVIAFAAEKNLIQSLLDGLQERVDPEIITPAMFPLALQIIRNSGEKKNLLLLHTDVHSFTMVLILDGRPLFFRRLSYPEQMILHPPFSFDTCRMEVIDKAAAEQCIQLICGSIERSLDYFRLESKIEIAPEAVILSGPLAETENMADVIALALHLPVETVDVLAFNKIECSEEIRAQWQRQCFNRAVALAMQGFGKKSEINFRKDAFAKKRTLFSSRKQLQGTIVALGLLMSCFFGYLWNDYRLLQDRDRALRTEMTTIFKQTFPKITQVHEPYAEMKAALKSIQGPGSPTLLFAADKRVLGLLADISARIPETVTLRVNRLAIDRDFVLIKGTTDTFISIDTIKNSLSASSRYKTVQIVSATADTAKNSGTIRFEIQLQLEGV